jgi:APA family basic amino acid/polyamine antiporter
MRVVDEKTNMPKYSTIFAAFFSFSYIALWYASINEIFGIYIGLDEIPIVLIYGLYIFLYIWYMKEFKDLSFIKRYVIPIFATIGSLIILYGGITNPSIGIYLGISVLAILLGLLFYRKN